MKAAQRLFGGDRQLAEKLLSRIELLRQAPTLKDIVLMPPLHFHKLENKGRSRWDGFYAIDLKSRKDPWRLIVQPLDDDQNPIRLRSIDKIASSVRVVGIEEVSRHYG